MPPTLSTIKKPFFGDLPPRRGQRRVKTQKTLPADPRGPDKTALATRLQTERVSAKNRSQAPGPQKTAALRVIRRAARTFVCRGTLRGSNVTPGRAGAAARSHDARPAHPQPATGRGRRGNASNTARQRRRRRPDTKKRRRGARQSDPTSEACVTRRPFRASQRRRSGGV